MRKRSKVILFIAVAAITFGSLHRFVGHRYDCGSFRNGKGCSPEKRQPEEKPAASPVDSTTSI